MAASKLRQFVILLAVFVISIFQLGSMKALGVFIPYFVDQLDMSEAEAGLSCGIGIAVARLLGALWGVFTMATSSRFVTVLGGVFCAAGFYCMSLAQNHLVLHVSMAIMSIGLGLPMVAKVMVLSDYFKESFNTANSIGFAGGAFGMIVLAPICEFLISQYGWRHALLILGAVSLNISVAGLVMTPVPKHDKDSTLNPEKCVSRCELHSKTEKICTGQSSHHKPCQESPKCDAVSKNHEPLDKETCRHRSYGSVNENPSKERLKTTWFSSICEKFGLMALAREPHLCLYLAAFALQEVAVTGWMLFLFTYTILLGFEKQVATMFSSIGGIGTLFGRLFSGPCTDRGICSARAQIGIFAFGGCVNLFLYPFISDYWGLNVLSFLTGMFVGTTSPLYVTLLKELFPGQDSFDFSGSVSLHFTTRGIGMLCGGPLTGWIHEKTGDFHVAFYALAGFEAIGALLILITPSLTQKLAKNGHVERRSIRAVH